jgi:hypothetical protein
MLMARVGRPVDKPIIKSAFNAARYVRLTAELTRKSLMTCMPAIKDAASIRFNKEIYRDGPGYTAEMSLPDGIIATDVIDRRDYLAAGFQLPVAQVWPEPVKGAHPGVLAIWVGDRPVDRMRAPKSPLLTCGKLDFFGQLPWGHDVRMRPVAWRLGGRNSLFGGMPNTGKTVAARNVALATAFDPLVRFAMSELKGSGDYDPLEPLCAEGLYISGSDEGSKVRTLEMLRWLDDECDRRGPLIRKRAASGLNTENSLNRAIAEADESLFPLLAVLDEIQELITDPQHGKEAKALLTSLVKKGRFAGIHLMLGTQRIDKESVPRGISSNISNRLCLGVTSHVETDLVLGTGAYKRGARPTAFVPPADGDNPWAGWGYLAGRDQPVQPDYIDVPTARASGGDGRWTLRGDRGTRGSAPRPGPGCPRRRGEGVRAHRPAGAALAEAGRAAGRADAGAVRRDHGGDDQRDGAGRGGAERGREGGRNDVEGMPSQRCGGGSAEAGAQWVAVAALRLSPGRAQGRFPRSKDACNGRYLYAFPQVDAGSGQVALPLPATGRATSGMWSW